MELDLDILTKFGQATTQENLRFMPLGLRTKNTHPTNLSDGVNTYGLHRQRHQCCTGWSGDQWKLVYANRLSESAAPNSITVQGAIEYPIGTITAVTFSSASSVTIAVSGADVFSDPLPVAIPAGAIFYTHTLVTVASAGMKWPQMDVLTFSSANGEGLALGTGTPPAVTSNPTPSSPTSVYGPVAIVGRCNAPNAIAINGDSISSGNGDDQTRIQIGYIARALNSEWPVLCIAQSGELASNPTSNGTGFAINHKFRKALALACNCNYVNVNYGNNDLGAGVGASATEAALQVIWNMWDGAGLTVIAGTVGTRTTSTDNWETATNQTLTTEFAPTQAIDTVNTFVRGVSSPPYPVAMTYDVNAAVRDAVTYKWLFNGAPDAYTIDGIHPSPLGHSLMAALLLPFYNFVLLSTPIFPTAAEAFATANADWDVRSLSGLTNGASVSSWTDNNAGLAATSSTNKPTYVTGATPEGAPVVRFASASESILTVAANAAISNIFTNGGYMIMAFRPNSLGGGSAGAVWSKTSTHRLCMSSAAAMLFQQQFSVTNASFTITTPTDGASDWIVMSILYNGTTGNTGATMVVNGTTSNLTAAPSGTIINDSADTLVIGNTTAATRGWDGDIIRIAMWSQAPPVAYRNAAYNWLRGYVGI